MPTEDRGLGGAWNFFGDGRAGSGRAAIAGGSGDFGGMASVIVTAGGGAGSTVVGVGSTAAGVVSTAIGVVIGAGASGGAGAGVAAASTVSSVSGGGGGIGGGGGEGSNESNAPS
jgi:hypothetical protein